MLAQVFLHESDKICMRSGKEQAGLIYATVSQAKQGHAQAFGAQGTAEQNILVLCLLLSVLSRLLLASIDDPDAGCHHHFGCFSFACIDLAVSWFCCNPIELVVM